MAISIPAVALKKCFESLYRALSISVPFCSENLVGKVIFGEKLCAITESRYSLILGLVVVFNKSILKSPNIITSFFPFCNWFSINVNSSLNWRSINITNCDFFFCQFV